MYCCSTSAKTPTVAVCSADKDTILTGHMKPRYGIVRLVVSGAILAVVKAKAND